MADVGLGFMDENDRLPFGSRVADAVRDQMRARLMGIAEIARLVRADKRDVRRLLNEGTCGPRLWDGLAKAFGWDLIEAVMTPVIGADPLTAREQELRRERAEIDSREERLVRVREAHRARSAVVGGRLRLVPEPDGPRAPLGGRGDRTVGAPAARDGLTD